MRNFAPINRNNIAVIIVTYNPDKKITAVLERVREMTNRIIIVDNASQNQISIMKLLKDSETFICLDNNKGIAVALNEGIKYVERQKLGVEWILTLDQDSVPDKNLLLLYSNIIENESNTHNIGLIGASYLDFSIKSPVKYREDSLLITSGLLHNINIFNNVGYYLEEYFIDYVDFEFSLRCKSFGYKNYKVLHKVLDHSLGIPKQKRILGIKILSTNHNAIRRYFMVRNGIWTCKLYWKKFPKEILYKSINICSNIIRMLLVDDDKINKIKAIGRGLKDGFTKSPKY